MRGLPLLAAAALAPLVLAAIACTVDTTAVTEVTAPDYNQFKGVLPNGSPAAGSVSALLERRCGTIDCHGQIGRPLRIYGEYGLRFIDDAGSQPGMSATTEIEHQANYQSVIGLQPELMTEVVQGNAPPEDLMLLRKPLQLERHKGGQVFTSGDDAYLCLTTWLGGQANFTNCANAVAQ